MVSSRRRDVDSKKYKDMVEQELSFGGDGGIIGAIEKYNLDVLVVPANQDIANDLAAKMGFPAISVPLGFGPNDTAVEFDEDKPNLVTVAPGIPWVYPVFCESDRILIHR
jgi:amidase